MKEIQVVYSHVDSGLLAHVRINGFHVKFIYDDGVLYITHTSVDYKVESYIGEKPLKIWKGYKDNTIFLPLLSIGLFVAETRQNIEDCGLENVKVYYDYKQPVLARIAAKRLYNCFYIDADNVYLVPAFFKNLRSIEAPFTDTDIVEYETLAYPIYESVMMLQHELEVMEEKASGGGD